ncbi:zinc transporter ZIP10-like isoform X2 [Branchiostoma floridae]|uniref:Zinc transporter ZIP10-like isoform X2 n=1 Tax=Branchiostoma floridae TaxID=7739 RepID=A0A9J7HG23_BRAFL|nr:zinc transporter ZIP10-like isoform X2 [Branchiostoma floridae]
MYSLLVFMVLLSGLWLQTRADIAQDREGLRQHTNTSLADSAAANSTSDVLLSVFQKYGTGDGTIDFHGFEKLLTSLGLGKVKIIEEDDDLEHGHGKHDYATHLDLIDHHDQSTDDHIVRHEHNHTVDRTIKGQHPTGDDISQTRSRAHGHPRRHQHGSEDSDEDEHGAHPSDQHNDSVQKLADDDHRSSKQSINPARAKKSQRLRVRDSRSFLPTKVDSAAPGLVRRNVPKQARTKHAETGKHWHEPHETDAKCLSPKEILNDFSAHTMAISERQFLHICPVLITQIDSRACIQHGNGTQVVRTEPLPGRVGRGTVWGWASLAITVISLVSLLAVAMVPLTTRSFYKYLITFLVALAVGCLSGDAVLHLIPHALGIHGAHDEPVPGENGHQSEGESRDAVWKGCVVLVGIFSFFIMEKAIGVVTSARNQIKRKDRRQLQNNLFENQENFVGYKLSTTFSEEPEIELSLLDKGVQGGQSHSHGGQSHSHGDQSHSHGGQSHSHGGHSHDMNRNAGIASVAWMVIMGDGLHNFADGVTIGAAFATSLTTGLSTSIAVFCHELPHELGDFAILLKAGMSFKQAITYNLVSGIISFVGMAVGVGIGKSNEVGPWVFALSAGMFLYIALVDMLPELLRGYAEDEGDSCNLKKTSDSACEHFLLQSAGLVTGVVIMLLIAVFEDDLEKVLEQ